MQNYARHSIHRNTTLCSFSTKFTTGASTTEFAEQESHQEVHTYMGYNTVIKNLVVYGLENLKLSRNRKFTELKAFQTTTYTNLSH